MKLNLKSICIFFYCFLASESHLDDAYYNDFDDLPINSNWMSRIPDSAFIRKISIPGTHNSASRTPYNPIVNCQSLTIPQQLKGGIRFLDLRLRHIENVFALHHGVFFLKLFFGDVLNMIVDFLIENPSETVLIRVREEHVPERINRSFDATFGIYFKRYRKFIWDEFNYKLNPTLKDIRGKILVLQEFYGIIYGLWYKNFKIQDKYNMKSNWALHEKWLFVKTHLLYANGNRTKNNLGFINYLSGSGWSFPYFVSSGHLFSSTSSSRLATGLTTPGWSNAFAEFPRVNCFIGICTIAFEGTNVLTKNFVHNLSNVGIVVSDFPGQGLIEAVINVNFR